MPEKLKKISDAKLEEYKYSKPYPELYECPYCGAVYGGDMIKRKEQAFSCVWCHRKIEKYPEESEKIFPVYPIPEDNSFEFMSVSYSTDI